MQGCGGEAIAQEIKPAKAGSKARRWELAEWGLTSGGGMVQVCLAMVACKGGR